MKTIILSPSEYIANFKAIAKFKFESKVIKGLVYITAPAFQLERLGY